MNKNKEDELNSSQISTLHLYDLAHSTRVSALTKLYTELFTCNIDSKQLNLPVTLDYKICTKCGILLIPGINMKLRVRYHRSKNKRTNIGQLKKISPDNMVDTILKDLQQLVENKVDHNEFNQIVDNLQGLNVEKLTFKQVIHHFKREIYHAQYLPITTKHSLTTSLSNLVGTYKWSKLETITSSSSRYSNSTPPVFRALPLPMLIAPIKSSSSVEKMKPTRILQIKCLKCNDNIEINNLIQTNDKKKDSEISNFEAKWTQENSNKVSKTSKAKLRAKSRKQNNLSAMLNNKKKEKEKGGIGSLQLMDFLGN